MALAPTAHANSSGFAAVLLDSGGGDSGGGDTTPVIEYDDSSTDPFTDIVGHKATVAVSPAPDKTIRNVEWSLPAGTFKNQDTPNALDGGFVNRPFASADLSQQSLTFYWGESGGTDTAYASISAVANTLRR